jgi:hypothetical protein
MPTINGKTYRAGEVPESILESLGLDQLREVARQDQDELMQQSLGAAKSAEALAKADHREEIRAEAKRLGEEVRAEQMPLDELKELVDRQVFEAAQQDEQRKQFEQQELDKLEKEFAGKSLEEIQQIEIEARAKAKLAETPEAKETERVESLEKQTDDLQYVHDQLKKGVDAAIEQKVRQVISADQEAINKSLAIQQEFVRTHKYYAQTLSNGEKMRDWVQASGAAEFTAENLHSAYLHLKDKGELDLLSQTQLDAKEQLEHQFKTGEKPQTVRRSSTISTTRGSSLYDFQKKEPTPEELETMPMDKLKNLINSTADPIELAEERRRGIPLNSF